MSDSTNTDDEPIVAVNDHLVMISGESASGKSASLRNIPNQSRWMYLNAEAGKKLPFKNNFHEIIVTDPYHVRRTAACIRQLVSDAVAG